ncbi:hypothetical protein NKI56_30125 [Mesorhizobium sp. M0622]|uniref:hypothetical protein n=1 Tax=Mesorhizobium sp. M0622 TaxID=2956975 RepID=UPI00333A1FB3
MRLAALRAVEKEATGLERTQLLERLLQDGSGIIVMDAGRIMGYGFRRNFGRGELIGPVAASSEVQAKGLIASLISTAKEFVRIDIEGAQTGPVPWLEGQGLADWGPVTRMVRGRVSPCSWIMKQFAVASQAFG